MEPNVTANSATALPKFGWKDKIGYAFGDFGCNMSFALISAFMVDFYTQYIGISTAAWAVIIILTKVWDGINDPIMGGVMDAVRIGKGKSKFKPWIKIGSIGLIVSGALVFLPIPDAAAWVKITVCIVTYLLWDVCYTFLNVPYGALSSAITGDPIERTQLSTWRSIGAAIGGAICMLLPLLVYDQNDNIIGDRLIWIGLGMGAIAFVAYMLCIRMTTERVVVPVEHRQRFNYFKTIKGFLHNRPLLALCLATFASIVFLMSSTQTTKWLFQVHFGDAGTMVTVASILTYLPMVFFIPFTAKLVRRFGKKYAVGVPFALSIVAGIVMLIVPVPADKTGSYIYIAGLMVIQLGGGMFNLIAWAMVNDCIDYQEIKTGTREEGSIYAMYSLFRKISQGVALSLPLLCMQAVDYNPQANPIGNQLPGVSERMVRMSVGLMLIGAVVMFVSFLLIYNLGKKEVAEMAKTLGRSAEDVDVRQMLQEEADNR